ncbi:DUF3796 domain-containing protein [Romboutsia weinsteinii]|uniref:DUF3796 domain-containing protein n=1 Tax=Romboutsia weinsteinii TaxID=2020949 RepID=A0A371J4W3_9FIRM|nr:DUF3796 domain-containing protein [Romboutsia weinsteinii]RDY27831.1 DUF3796 domain-containing protein [Romboutsia weinsteinii]
MEKRIKKLNKLGFLGFLGLIGLIGCFTDHTGFYGFFGFFLFFYYFNVIPDELFKQNLMKATTPAFFLNLITVSISLFISAFTKDISILVGGMAISFGVSILTFSGILAYIEIKESKGLQ